MTKSVPTLATLATLAIVLLWPGNPASPATTAAAAVPRRLALARPVPVLRHGDRLGFLASCQPGGDSVRVQATARYRGETASPPTVVLDQTVDCPAGGGSGSGHVTLRLAQRHRCYRHAALLSGAYFPAGVKLRMWLAPKATAKEAGKFESATARLVTETTLPEYWELPAQCGREEDGDANSDEALAGVCYSWGQRIVLERLERLADRTCRAEAERYHIHDYPMAVQGDIGILTHLRPIKEAELLRHWASNGVGGSGTFSLSTWIYIEKPCPASWCNLLLGLDIDDNHRSPGLLVTNQNRIHYQGHLSRLDDYKASAYLSAYRLPMRTWMRIVMVWQPHEVQIGVFDTDDKEMFSPIVHSWSRQVHYADSELSLLLGGYHLTPSIHGYIAQTVLFRGRALLPLGLAVRTVSAPAFLARSSWLRPRLDGYCRSLHRRLEAQMMRRRRAVENRGTCQSWGETLLRQLSQPTLTLPGGATCAADIDVDEPADLPDGGRGRRWAEQVMEQRLKALPLAASNGGPNRLSDATQRELGQLAYRLAVNLMQTSNFDAIDRSAALLNASACMDHCSARFLLSAMLSYGLQSDRWMDFTESNALLLVNVLHCRHQLSLLALATKHYLGADGAEANRELALAYFLHLARRTPAEKDELASEDYNRVDMVRLTDEQKVKEVTHAEDDLFHWISHQAGQGVPWAKRKMADLLYWGSNGVQRNVQKGLSYLKQAADEDASPSAAHDYGTLLIKGGHGPERVPEGLRYLQRAADLAAADERPDPRTLTSLGWYAERHEGDMAKAIDLYRRAAALGGQDAVYNLGVLHDIGFAKYGLAKSRGDAFRYFMQAAGHGLLQASVMVSSYRRRHMPLIGLPRDLVQATEWARYVAELNPKVGALLTKAIVAYRKDQIETSALWYTLAAYCGLEVANFNLAFLCDQQGYSLARRFAKECQFHHYNRSVMRDENQVHAKSLTRMGDYYSSDLAHIRNLTASVDFYTRAVRKGDPEAAYNLAYLVEIGQLGPAQAAAGLSIELDGDGGGDGGWQLMKPETKAAVQIYKLCEKLSNLETDLPCRLARYRLKISTYLVHYIDALKATLVASLLVLIAWRYVCASQ